MLASIIANLQNVDPVRATKLPTVKIDRGGGGPSFPGQGYEVVDFLAAIQTFPEIRGEDTFVRAVRRARWIAEVLPKIKEARERREAGAFLTGTQFGYAAGYSAGIADAAVQVPVDRAPVQPVEQVAIASVVKEAPKRVEVSRRVDRDRGDGSSGAGLFIAVLAIGAIGAVALRRRRR